MKEGRTRIGRRDDGGSTAFTLLEMLIVIGIIGILAGLTAPTLKSLGRSDVMGSALRQLVDDLNLARLRAINGRTTVYVVFFPHQSAPLINGVIQSNRVFFTNNQAANRLIGGQLTAYAMYAARTLGDQPGRSTPHYLTEWKSLPKGVYFDTNIFYSPSTFLNAVGLSITNPQPIMIPNDNPPVANPSALQVDLPYIAFDAQGRLVGHPGTNVILPVTLGSLVYRTDPPQYTNYTLFIDPQRVIEKADRGLAVTSVRPGVEYYVTGLGGTVTYGGRVYVPGRTFTGLAGTPNFTVVNAPQVEVREVNGVEINWLTGRARQRRADQL